MLGNSYIKPSEIITAAAQELRDTGFTHGLGKPFYMSALQQGLTEMNYATTFHKRIFNVPIPENLTIDLPDDFTEADQVYVYSGDECSSSRSTIVFIKPNYHAMGNGQNFIAQGMGRNLDAMQFSQSWTQTPPGCLFFGGIYNGQLQLSPSCAAAFNRVYIPYTGIGMDCFGEDFRVPMWCRQAMTDYVIHKVALALEREDVNFFRGVIARKESQIAAPMGSWNRAISRYKRSDKKTQYDTTAYKFDFGHTP